MPTPAKRRRRTRRPARLAALAVPLGAGAALALCAWGFVAWTRVALDKQTHFAPDSAHPYDGYAALCLFGGMLALATLLLALRDPPPMRWRRTRRAAERARTPRRNRARQNRVQ